MEDWGKILGGIRATTRGLTSGEALFREGDEARAVFQVERGRLRLSRRGAILHVAHAGSLFAESSLFAFHYPCDAVADMPSRVKVFPSAAVLLYLRVHPDLNLAFSAALAREVQRLRAGQEIMRLPGARDRVVAWLTLVGAADATVALDQPLSAVASEMGLTHEALYRTLAALVKDGRLERPGKRTFRLK